MNIVVDNLLTHYERSGNGPVVLIIPGWADTSASWRDLAKGLAKKHEVIVVDLPGFGGTQTPVEQSWGLTDYAMFVAHFLNKLGVRTAAIIGHSNGGAIALRGLSTQALAADRLVLLASAGIRNTYNGRNRTLRILTKTGKYLSMLLPGSVKKRLRKKVYKTVGSDMLVAEHMQATFKRVVTDDVQADADKVDLPTLLVYGQNDSDTPIDYGRILHEHLPNSTLQIIPDAEHFLHTQQTAAVLSLIEEFIA